LLRVASDGPRQASAVDPAPLTANFDFSAIASHASTILSTSFYHQQQEGDARCNRPS
jgi:hypothetical protein